MNIKKSISSIVLSLLLLITFLGGCAPKNQPSGITPENETYASRTAGIDFSDEIGKVREYSVLISSSASETEMYAAERLIYYVEQVTGVILSYRADGSYANEKVISIGETDFLTSSGITVDVSELGNDGFVIKSNGDALLICGGSDRGTLYGVFDFIEYYLGVKFLTAEVTYIPQNAEAAVYRSDRTEIPAFEYRVYLDPSSFYNDSTEFTVARRFTSEYLNIPESAGGNLKWFQGYETHNSLYWAGITDYVINGQLDPAYMEAFSNDGENTIINTQVGGLCLYAADLCYTDGINEDGSYATEITMPNGVTRKTAIGMAIAGMESIIRNDQEANNYYLFGQTDTTSRPCLCSNCRSAASKYTDAGIMIRFINALSDAIADFVEEEQIERDITIVMFAYQYSSYAPVVESEEGAFTAIDPTCVPNENVAIRLAPIGMNRFIPYDHERQNDNAYGSDYLQKWESICDNFMLWDYTTYHPRFYWFYPTMPLWHDRLTQANSMGVKYVLLQSNHQERTIYQTILEGYVAAKMLWNPNYDINEIIHEFHRYYFGEEAGTTVDTYIQLMKAACYEALDQNNYAQATGLDYCGKGLLKSVMGLIDDAIFAVNASELPDTEKSLYTERLEMLKFQPRYMYLYNYMQYETDQVQMNIEAEQLISDIMSQGGVYWSEGNLFDLENVIFK